MEPNTVTRPWGTFREFIRNQPSSVKIITVTHGEMLSLQHHTKRSEFWRVLTGTPLITINDTKHHAAPGDEFFIESGMAHRIEAPNSEVSILEISLGDFDENDIVRLEDKYGRI